jgi:membrane-bound lytic murein transglycosylase B
MRTAQLLMAIAMVLADAAIPTLAQAPAKVQLKPEVEEFIDQMVRINQFEEAAMRQVFAQLKAHDGVVKAIGAPATAKPWHEFRNMFVTPKRISGGLEFWQQHAELLARARDVYGVPEEIVVSIVGVETIYGRRLGSFRVIDALYTLGFEMTERATFFRGEMEQFLLLARENALDPLGVKGSFAGAMGMPQFIPTSYRKYAVDFDGDGRINLWDSTADVVGSVANYLRHFGWVWGQPVTVPARISGTQFKEVLEAGLRPQLTLQQMQPKGVEAIEELPPNVQAGLFSLDAEQGQEYWLALNNFYVITRYNRSKNYAMAVYQLAKAIAHEREGALAARAALVKQ